MEDLSPNTWPKTITVDKRIVGILSTSTYKNFPRALKEIITNSYDADATEVHIKIDLTNEIIVIEDNGRGMDSEDFGLYLRIAGKDRRKASNTTSTGRKIIGQFGVGFLAVFPFFKNYSIVSSKIGSDKTLYAEIPLSRFFDVSSGSLDVGSIKINGGERLDLQNKSRNFTKITLKGFNELTKSFFKTVEKQSKRDVSTYNGIERIKWILSDDLPLEYRVAKFNDIFNYRSSQRFSVFINNEKLYREVYGEEILETHNDEFNQIGNITFKYFISTPRKAVSPYEGRYLKIRNLNVGIGDKRTDFGEGKGGGARSRLHWLTGEVHIIDGMNDLIKVSRDGFNYSKDFERLESFFYERLNHHSNKLESEAILQKEITQTGKTFRIQNINNLNPASLENKVKKYEREGFTISTVSEFNNRKGISINEEKKEIFIDEKLSSFQKSIIINDTLFHVRSESWNYENSKFPACVLKDDNIIVNSSYPLFRGRKYTDIFVKMHVLLLVNYSNKIITEKAYSKLTTDILTFYSDY